MSNLTVNGYALPAHLSHSALTTFLSCGHKYYLSRVVKEAELPAWWFIGGNAVHTASENYDHDALKGVTGTAEQYFVEAFAEHTALTLADVGQDVPDGWRAGGRATKAYPNKEDSDWWLANGPAMVQSWIDWRAGSGWRLFELNGVPAIELGFDFAVDDEFAVKMFIDRLMVNEHGELVILDLKSGSSTPKSHLQLAMYAYGCEKVLGIRPKWGTYWKAREGTTTPLVDLDVLTSEKVQYIVSGFDKLRKSGIFLPNLDECGWCGFKNICEWSK